LNSIKKCKTGNGVNHTVARHETQHILKENNLKNCRKGTLARAILTKEGHPRDHSILFKTPLVYTYCSVFLEGYSK